MAVILPHTHSQGSDWSVPPAQRQTSLVRSHVFSSLGASCVRLKIHFLYLFVYINIIIVDVVRGEGEGSGGGGGGGECE